MTRWEYRKLWACDGGPTAGELAELGADGWELAGILPSTGGAVPVLIFKRPLDTFGHDRPSVGEREDEQDGPSEFARLGMASTYSLTVGGGSGEEA